MTIIKIDDFLSQNKHRHKSNHLLIFLGQNRTILIWNVIKNLLGFFFFFCCSWKRWACKRIPVLVDHLISDILFTISKNHYQMKQEKEKSIDKFKKQKQMSIGFSQV